MEQVFDDGANLCHGCIHYMLGEEKTLGWDKKHDSCCFGKLILQAPVVSFINRLGPAAT